MRRSLALISEGMLSGSTKKAITVASIGWLVFSGTPTDAINQNAYVRIENDSGGRYKKSESEKEKWDRIIIEEDEIIIAILKEAMKIINF